MENRLSDADLCAGVRDGDTEAGEILCRRYAALINKMARRLAAKTGTERDDLAQAGMEGLLDSARRYDPTSGVKMITYAVWWISRSMRREAAETGLRIHIPSNMRDRARKYRRLDNKLTERGMSRRARTRAIAEEMGCSEESVRFALAVDDTCSSFVSLNTPDEDGGELGDALTDPLEPTTEERALHSITLHEITGMMNTVLTPREQIILRRRYGFDGDCETLAQVGGTLDLSRERVRQHEATAIRKLRAAYREG